ncbi:MAG TPA: helix-turn-helix transcriptional regulator [Candidatus Binatia bacterium]|nr:helix-turn-helix transcriptional regulator [Candidatus Binatia bacterium]
MKFNAGGVGVGDVIAANASRSTVSKIEGGSLRISDYDLLLVAAALRVHFTELFPEID